MMTQINVRHIRTEKWHGNCEKQHILNTNAKEASLSVWLSVIPYGFLKNTVHSTNFVAGENEGLVKAIFAI